MSHRSTHSGALVGILKRQSGARPAPPRTDLTDAFAKLEFAAASSPTSPLTRSSSGPGTLSRRQSGRRPRSSLIATAARAQTPIPLAPANLLAMLDDAENTGTDVLVIDVRPLTAFVGPERRIRRSVNCNVPSLLLKRFRRGNTANFALGSFVTTEAGKRRLAAVESVADTPIVVVDERGAASSSSATAGSVLLSVFQRDTARTASVSYLASSWEEFASAPDADRWLESGDEAGGASNESSPITPGPAGGSAHGLTTLESRSLHQPSPQGSPERRQLAPPRLKRLEIGGTSGIQRARSPTPLKIDRAFGAAAPPTSRPKRLSIQALCAEQSKTPVARQFHLDGPSDPSDARASVAALQPGENDPPPSFEVSEIIPGLCVLACAVCSV